jgi:heterodisulfide reductase subunit C
MAMNKVIESITSDVRYREGLKSCMNCGVCTAICPAAEFYDYDPRMLITIVQSNDEKEIEELLKSDFIWYCGQCMSCKTRCPRGNCPGLIINVLRKVSQEFGYFTQSRMGRQQYAVKRTVGENILRYGYCVHPEALKPELHPEQGPVWEWIFNHRTEVYRRLKGNLNKSGPGTLRKISPETMNELHSIFEVTGGMKFYKLIEDYSKKKVKDMGFEQDDKNMNRYFMHVYKDTGEEDL